MNTKYYENLSLEASENPDFWFAGMERKHLPVGYRGAVAKDAEEWDLWHGFLEVLGDARRGKRSARTWVLRTFADYQTSDIIAGLSENDLPSE